MHILSNVGPTTVIFITAVHTVAFPVAQERLGQTPALVFTLVGAALPGL